MLVMNTSTGMAMAPGSPMTAEKAQQLQAQNNKALQQQQQQAVMLQQQAMQQQQQQTIQQLHFQQHGKYNSYNFQKYFLFSLLNGYKM